MKFIKLGLILAVTLVGAAFITPSLAAAETATAGEVNCYEHADHVPQTSSLDLRVGKRVVAGKVHLRGLVRPIQEIAEPDVAAAVRRYCQQRAKLFLDVYRQGKRIKRFVISANSKLSNGRLNQRKSFRQRIKPIGNEKFCIRLHGFVRDPDQVVAFVDSGRLCGETSRERKVEQLF